MIQTTGPKPGWEAVIKDFQAQYPQITVNASYLTADQFSKVVATQFTAGNPPDLYRAPPGNSDIVSVFPMAEAGKLLDLRGRPWVASIPAQMKPYVTYKGGVYALPIAYTVFAVAYNTQLFQQLGLQVPNTMSDVLAMCRKIRAAGKVPFVIGASQGLAGLATWVFNRTANEVYAVAPNWTEERNQNKVSVATSPLWRQVFQSIVDMKDAGCFQPAPQGTSVQEQYVQFAQGKAVMTQIGSTELAPIQKMSPDLKVAMFNLPGATKSAVVVNFAGNSVSAAAATKSPDAVKAFIDFAAQPSESAKFAGLTFAISPADAAKGALPDYMQEMTRTFKDGRYMLTPTVSWPNPALTQIVADGFAGLFTGQKTVDSAVKDVEAGWKQP
jgi:raffinose/stachyose/melibiose transport system substrate-binding protein